LGSGQANALYNANLQRLVRTFYESEGFHFNGTETPNDFSFTSSVRPYDRVVKGVRILVNGTAPNSTGVIVKLEVDSAVKTATYTLAAAAQYIDIAVTVDGNTGGSNPFSTIAADPQSGPGVIVLATKALRVQITAINTATDIWVFPYWRPRVI
jgi:hypothetical protein